MAFETLKSKDEKSAKEIDMQMRKLQRIQVPLSSLHVITFCLLPLSGHNAHNIISFLHLHYFILLFKDKIVQLKSKMVANSKEYEEKNRIIKEVAVQTPV